MTITLIFTKEMQYVYNVDPTWIWPHLARNDSWLQLNDQDHACFWDKSCLVRHSWWPTSSKCESGPLISLLKWQSLSSSLGLTSSWRQKTSRGYWKKGKLEGAWPWPHNTYWAEKKLVYLPPPLHPWLRNVAIKYFMLMTQKVSEQKLTLWGEKREYIFLPPPPIEDLGRLRETGTLSAPVV